MPTWCFMMELTNANNTKYRVAVECFALNFDQAQQNAVKVSKAQYGLDAQPLWLIWSR